MHYIVQVVSYTTACLCMAAEFLTLLWGPRTFSGYCFHTFTVLSELQWCPCLLRTAIGLFGRICFNLPKLYLAIACFYCFVTHPVLYYVLHFVFCKLCAGPWGRPAQVLMRHFLFQISFYIYLELRAAIRNVRLYRIIDPTLSHLLTLQDTRVATVVSNSKYQWYNVIISPCTRFVFEGSSKH